MYQTHTHGAIIHIHSYQHTIRLRALSLRREAGYCTAISRKHHQGDPDPDPPALLFILRLGEQACLMYMTSKYTKACYIATHYTTRSSRHLQSM
jgi:hypothetical protein